MECQIIETHVLLANLSKWLNRGSFVYITNEVLYDVVHIPLSTISEYSSILVTHNVKCYVECKLQSSILTCIISLSNKFEVCC